MIKLKSKGLKWLKGFHLIAVSSWIGGALALLLLYFLKKDITDGQVLYGINQSIIMIPVICSTHRAILLMLLPSSAL